MNPATRREQHILNAIEAISQKLNDVALTASIQGERIMKLDFNGSDLTLKLENGRTWLFSAVTNHSGKAVIEFACSSRA